MASSPIRLYLDEDVSILVGEMIRARGFDVLTTRDAGNLAASDLRQLEFSIREGRVLLTHNRVDFERLALRYFEDQLTHAGMIVAFRRLPSDIVSRLLGIMSREDADAMVNQIRYI